MSAPGARPGLHPTEPLSRMFACVPCQRRKVRCDRNVPCAKCLKSQVRCIPSDQLPRRRKRRFPDKELLERLLEYEHLLRENHIYFSPLHGDSTDDYNISAQASERTLQIEPPSDREARRSSSPVVAKSDTAPEAKYTTHFPIGIAWDHAYGNVDPIFGICQETVDLSFQQPEPAQIFRLWQIYLDNVDPLLKVTHTQTLQSQVVDAVSVWKLLCLGIYCVAVLSLPSGECEVLFDAPKQSLLAKCQSACQQALVNCGFLRSDDRNCLIAFFFCMLGGPTRTAVYGPTFLVIYAWYRGPYSAARGHPQQVTVL
ncbi:hypothetical protein N7532_003311 [Penicillium argentinense]|uniref:Zn(2)-C6 fungal-type domain-containing protein n=1 Tax=Penicillium argentinense TaxID=1131581 RepID=A0A9W9KF36_9EURO|nr:uncharacterized protein N7532_003311 [Penicillium argentinense]KAJ5102782.1 hypothetical protein N7532_003311 [Penicillium argentinense]